MEVDLPRLGTLEPGMNRKRKVNYRAQHGKTKSFKLKKGKISQLVHLR